MRVMLSCLFAWFVAHVATAGVVVANTRAEPVSPWGKVLLTFDVGGTLPENAAGCLLQIAASNETTHVVSQALSLSGDLGLTAGPHRVLWDMKADGLYFDEAPMTFSVRFVSPETYLVIDLSGGMEATSYPVSELAAVPEGGWTDEHKTTKLVLRRIDAGSFILGEDQTNLAQCVTLTHPFYAGVFQVTQRQWELVMGDRPSYFTNETCYAQRPVDSIDFDRLRGRTLGARWPVDTRVDADSFIGVLRRKTGLWLELPTESQWEYACRAGTSTYFNNGLIREYPNSYAARSALGQLGRYWFTMSDPNSRGPACTTAAGTALVGTYKPNAWGLYDMHGNLVEWCLDWYGALPSGTDPVGPDSGERRVTRGGCWVADWPEFCSSYYRAVGYPSDGNNLEGVRLFCNLPRPSAAVTLRFDANGGACSVQSQTVARGSRLVGLPVLYGEGRTFTGWTTARVGGAYVRDGDVVRDDMTLYAHWRDDAALYQSIDLSPGPSASEYVVESFNEMPSGGWTDEYKTTKLVLRRLDAGSFILGENQTNMNNCVTLSCPFYVGVFMLTQRQWELIMGDRPSYFTNETCYAMRPVDSVSFNRLRGSVLGTRWPGDKRVDDDSFIGILRRKTGIELELPTESQWEYACRAGTTTYFNNGLIREYPGSYAARNALNEVGRNWFNMWTPNQRGPDCEVSAGTALVGTYKPNAWGLYDMHGNLAEWCLNWHTGSLTGTDPAGSGSVRIMRGGGWSADWPEFCASYYRCAGDPSEGNYLNGVRLFRTLSAPSDAVTLRFDANGGICSVQTQTVARGSRLTCLPVAVGEGLTFLGWSVEKAGGAYVVNGDVASGAMTLYAQWRESK